MILTFTHKDIALIAEKFISDKLSLHVKNYLFFQLFIFSQVNCKQKYSTLIV